MVRLADFAGKIIRPLTVLLLERKLGFLQHHQITGGCWGTTIEDWYAGRGSNPQPSAPEADALSN